MARKSKTRSRSDGWAITSFSSHKRHPAYYRKKNDNIEYVTFTHSEEVAFSPTDKVRTKKLKHNIDKKSKDSRYSHVVPRVYYGSRDSLGRETNKYSLDKEDRPLIEGGFRSWERRPSPAKKKPRK